MTVTIAEASIGSDVWKFVKKQISSPVKAGILALLIANFLNKNKKESVYTKVVFKESPLLESLFSEGAGVLDEDKWDKAKAAFEDSKGRAPSSDQDWGLVTTIYKNMGGRFSKETMQKSFELLTLIPKDMQEALKERVSTEVEGHRHTWRPGDAYSSVDNDHTHAVNGDMLVMANEHTHRLLSKEEEEALHRALSEASNNDTLVSKQRHKGLEYEVHKDGRWYFVRVPKMRLQLDLDQKSERDVVKMMKQIIDSGEVRDIGKREDANTLDNSPDLVGTQLISDKKRKEEEEKEYNRRIEGMINSYRESSKSGVAIEKEYPNGNVARLEYSILGRSATVIFTIETKRGRNLFEEDIDFYVGAPLSERGIAKEFKRDFEDLFRKKRRQFGTK